MSMLPEGVAACIGVSTDKEFAPEAVEAGVVRRFAQAIMDDDPTYWQDGEAAARHGGLVAPPLFPRAMFRRPFGTPGPFAEQAGNPDCDEAGTTATMALPAIIPFRGYDVLAGGSEVEFTRYARWGERVRVRSSYADIEAKSNSASSTARARTMRRAARTSRCPIVTAPPCPTPSSH